MWLWRRGRVEAGEHRARPGSDDIAFARNDEYASVRAERSGGDRRARVGSLPARASGLFWLGFGGGAGGVRFPASAGNALCVRPSRGRAPLPLTSASGPAHMDTSIGCLTP